MKTKVLHSVAGLALTLGMGVAAAAPAPAPAPAPSILGAATYQAMSSQQMASVTGETRKRYGIRIKITNTNTNTNTNTVCLILCTVGGDITLGPLPGI